MQEIIKRPTDVRVIKELLAVFPVVAILGARQCGKTILSKMIKYDHYFDLENPRDIQRLETPQLALEDLQGVIVIDEIQRKPDLFPLLRYLVDNKLQQKYLILGSASQDLIKQSSETLAGRIGFHFLSGFRLDDIGVQNWKKLWLYGSFPKSLLSDSDERAFLWLKNYIQTFLERDIPQLGINIAAEKLRRFWIMISHYQSNILSYSELGKSFGISDVTVRSYIEILEKTFMVRLLQPWHSNTKKRLVKRPKLYIRDTGIFHSLQSIESYYQLYSHPKLGASWEAYVIENIVRKIGIRGADFYFWATHAGAELDLFWMMNGKKYGVEAKYADAPNLSKSMRMATKELHLDYLLIVYPGKESYLLDESIEVLPVTDLDKILRLKRQK